MYRKQIEKIREDLERKMVFLVGPRQVGKTWLARRLADFYEKSVYLNYDNFDDREMIKQRSWLDNIDLLILDELHKMPDWKNYLKGVFDTKPESLKILVTGSARLDIFRQSGDSLVGRFFVHHLLPFSLSEIKEEKEYADLDRLIERGGFPEPFLAKDNIEAERWRRQYIDGLIRGDVLDFEKIHDFKAMQTVFEILRRSVGSPISLASIARDVQISPITAKKYLQILESLYIVFRVNPYSRNIARSILKEPKVYFFDTGLVKDDNGARLENAVAVSLLKSVLARNDYLGEENELKYLRTKIGKETDFALVRENKIKNIIEVKKTNHRLDKNLKYFKEKYDFPAVQIVKNIRNEREEEGIKILRAEGFLEDLYL